MFGRGTLIGNEVVLFFVIPLFILIKYKDIYNKTDGWILGRDLIFYTIFAYLTEVFAN